MHIQTHVMSGWCLANCWPLNSKERFLAMLAASLPDLDGASYFLGQEAYWKTHHVYGHNLLFALALSGIMSLFCESRAKCFCLFFGLVNLHFVMDLLGSGECWGIPYFLPFSDHSYDWSFCWNLDSWQNKLAALALLLWTIGIAVWLKRTPLEWLMPKLDSQLAALAQKLRRKD